jgi:hypothetical protein
MKILRRFLLVLTVTWAACCLWGGIDATGGIRGKDMLTAFFPLAIILAGRFVVFGLPKR